MPRFPSGPRSCAKLLHATMLDGPWWSGIIYVTLIYTWCRWVTPWMLIWLFSDSGKLPLVSVHILAAIGAAAPWLALFAAMIWAVSLVDRYRDRKRFMQTKGLEDLRKLDWREFEKLIRTAYEREGYLVEETPTGADGGVDMVLLRKTERWLVQCKHWKSKKVGVKTVRELLGVIASEGATAGILVASGHITMAARRFAETNPIELVDGPALVEMLRGLQPPAKSEPKPVPEPPEPGIPPCPLCGEPMLKKVARRGIHTGKPFWACQRFPGCRGKQPIKEPLSRG